MPYEVFPALDEDRYGCEVCGGKDQVIINLSTGEVSLDCCRTCLSDALEKADQAADAVNKRKANA